MEERVKKREERKRKESRNAKPVSKEFRRVEQSNTASKWMTYDDLNSLEKEGKILKTYFEDPKMSKHKDFNIKVRRGSREAKKVSITKPQQVHKASFFKCQFCGMILFNTRDVQAHDTHSKTFSNKFYSHKDMKGKRINVPKSDSCNCFFIVQKDWITEYDGNTGRIICPRKTCAVKLGVYSWSGLKCSCGEFKSPAFQIDKKSVTEVPQFLP